MKTIAGLLQDYRRALELAHDTSDKALCTMLLQELPVLEAALSNGDAEAVQSSLLLQRQIFGRSFLPGPAGESAELAFNQVAHAISAATPNKSFKPNPLRGSA